MDEKFNYELAFSRNIGWLTQDEQNLLKTKKVAIAGCGGVGGHYAETLARLGVGNFVIADFDEFEIHNFNRQNGAYVSNIGKKKVDVIASRILDINPLANVTKFENGIYEDSFQEFFKDVDLYIDGLDFFAVDVRVALFDYLDKLKLPSLTVAPIGMGAACVIATKDSMTLSRYFGMSKSLSRVQNLAKFLTGLSPKPMTSNYLVLPERIDLINSKAPSTPMGCNLCAGVGVTNVLKILIGRGKIKAAPWSLHFDAFNNKYKKTYVWLGHKNIFQKLKYALLLKAKG